MLKKLLESDSEQQMADYLGLKWYERAQPAERVDYRNGFYQRDTGLVTVFLWPPPVRLSLTDGLYRLWQFERPMVSARLSILSEPRNCSVN